MISLLDLKQLESLGNYEKNVSGYFFRDISVFFNTFVFAAKALYGFGGCIELSAVILAFVGNEVAALLYERKAPGRKGI